MRQRYSLGGPAALLLALALGLLSGARSAGAAPIPVSATLSHEMASGWFDFSCGPFGFLTCVSPSVDHDLTILLSDGSSVIFRANSQAEPVLSSVHSVRVFFNELTSAGGSLTALRSYLTAYDPIAFELIYLGGDLFDWDFNLFEPAHYRYTDANGTEYLLLGDGTGLFTLPEPATGALLLLAGALVPLVRRESVSSPAPR